MRMTHAVPPYRSTAFQDPTATHTSPFLDTSQLYSLKPHRGRDTQSTGCRTGKFRMISATVGSGFNLFHNAM
jgi:hypothetical protein